MILIGMSGFARSGKDAAAEYLVENHGFTRIAFADILRDFLYALNPLVIGWDRNGYGDLASYHTPLQEVIDEYGWDAYKETPYGNEIRRLLQRLGTECGRNLLGDNIWINSTFKDLDPNGKYIVTDARFLNEFAAIEDLGGVIIRVNRPGVGPANDHPSEMEALEYDFKYIIHNDGDLQSYHQKVETMMRILSGDHAGCRR